MVKGAFFMALTKKKIKAKSTKGGDYNQRFVTEKRNQTEEDKEDKSLFQIINPEFENYALDELALLAKEDPNALQEFHLRITPSLVSFTNAVCNQNRYLDYSECYIHFKRTATKAIQIYDPSFQKPYIHLLRAMLKLETKNLEKREAIRYIREKNFLGYRVFFDHDYLCDFSNNYEKDMEEILLTADIELFMQTLQPRQQEVFLLYYHQLTFQEISDTLNIPISTIAYWIKKILKLAKDFFQQKR